MSNETFCSGCGEKITNIILTAFQMSWHPTCLCCNVCGKDFSDGSPVQEGEDGYAYCRKCFIDTFAPKCGGCNQAILGPLLTAMNKKWHPDHFACFTCKQQLSGNFFPGDNG